MNIRENEFKKYLNKVMRRKANKCKDWISFDLDKNTIRLYSLVRGNEWSMTIDDFKLINPN